ncbi:MAG: glucose-1-phosphate cytidylyltransferase [Gammaproteobacteria bacterium]|nr:glucose-1-phosphate cytidylyltransferase [Gammaproteobacteria bacterium]
MKAVILAGGLGTRLSEETSTRPKPMVEVGGKPILWHIMKIYSTHGINDFVICCGYKGYVIKEYFANYLLHMSDVTFDIKKNKIDIHQNSAEPWRVCLIDTGDNTGTGGRLRRVRSYLDDETFCLTYGDGVSDIDIKALLDFHHQQKCLATLTAVQPPGRFGAFSLGNDQQKIAQFREKPKGDGAWVNGGFFALEPKVVDYIEGDEIFWEAEPLSKLADDGELAAYRHYGYWQAMDTLRDKLVLEELWRTKSAPWKAW